MFYGFQKLLPGKLDHIEVCEHRMAAILGKNLQRLFPIPSCKDIIASLLHLIFQDAAKLESSSAMSTVGAGIDCHLGDQ